MSETIKLKKGLDIKLAGKAEKILTPEIPATRYAVKPVDFAGLYPKVCVKPGDEVKAGSPLFYGKFFPEFKFTSPVSGKVVDVVRGERRKLLEVVVEVKGDDYIDFGKADPSKTDRSVIKEKLLMSGLWPALRQRPYNIIARPDQTPKAIFISAFDTAPLAPDLDFIVRNLPEGNFQNGLDVLKNLTDGKIHLVLNPDYPAADVLKKAKGVEFNYFSGPHPAGNSGIHIHHIDPVNKGEVVWVVNIQDVYSIGRLFSEGIYKPEKIVALAGSEVIKPKYYRIRSGACIDKITKDNIKSDNVRYISGNVLTGTKIEPDGFLGYYDSSVTVIPEGNYYEFLGWLGLGFKKFSFSKSFPQLACTW